MNFFSPLPHRPVTLPPKEVDRRFTFMRYRQVAVMLVVYALFYVCRLAFSATKTTLIEQNIYSAQELGYVGAAMLWAYAIGKVVNGFKIPLIPEPSSTDIYAQFVVEHLKPMIDENFMTLPDCANTCVGGISAGGSASYYMILKYPQVFGRAIICSPGFPMFDLDNMLRELDEYDMDALKDHRLAFYNGDQGIDVTSIDYVIAVYKKLKERGLTRRELMFILDTRQTHSEAAWGKYLPEFLRFLLAEDNSEPGN